MSKKKSAVDRLISALDQGLARQTPERRRQVLRAGAELLESRRGILTQPRCLYCGGSATNGLANACARCLTAAKG